MTNHLAEPRLTIYCLLFRNADVVGIACLKVVGFSSLHHGNNLNGLKPKDSLEFHRLFHIAYRGKNITGITERRQRPRADFSFMEVSEMFYV